MNWNPRHDPFVEASYFGYAVSAIACRQSATRYIPLLGIRDLARMEQEQLYEGVLNREFRDPDSAIKYAMGKGRQIIDNLLVQPEINDPVDYIH